MTYIIAEAGVNHNGSIALAENLIEAAASCGANAIKFLYNEGIIFPYDRPPNEAPVE